MPVTYYMDPIRWFYIYSPKYEIFHHILMDGVKDCSGFIMSPVFVPQEAFSGLYGGDGHFLSGNSVKYKVLMNILKRHPGEHILLTDVDLIVQHPEELRAFLEPYKRNDLTFMLDGPDSEGKNIGFAMIKSNPDTIDFFGRIYETLTTVPGTWDQGLVNDLLPSFTGSLGTFDPNLIINSNYYKDNQSFYVLQCLCSQDTYEKNLLEKLLSVALFLDIEPLHHLIPEDTWHFVREYHYRVHYKGE